jgi:hypothetical protein
MARPLMPATPRDWVTLRQAPPWDFAADQFDACQLPTAATSSPALAHFTLHGILDPFGAIFLF